MWLQTVLAYDSLQKAVLAVIRLMSEVLAVSQRLIVSFT